MNNKTYLEFTKAKVDFEKIVNNVKWVYDNKGHTEIVVKIPGDIINDSDKKLFMKHLEIIVIEFLLKISHHVGQNLM